jgi:hypothetical protein
LIPFYVPVGGVVDPIGGVVGGSILGSCFEVAQAIVALRVKYNANIGLKYDVQAATSNCLNFRTILFIVSVSKIDNANAKVVIANDINTNVTVNDFSPFASFKRYQGGETSIILCCDINTLHV